MHHCRTSGSAASESDGTTSRSCATRSTTMLTATVCALSKVSHTSASYQTSPKLTTDCIHPNLIRPEAHYKNNHSDSDFREDLLRPKLELTPGVPPPLPPLPDSLPSYLITTHEIRPFCDRPLPAIPTPGPRLRELREDIVEVRDVDDVPSIYPAALWDSSDFVTMELEDDDEGTVIGQVDGAPVIRLSAPPPTPLQGGRMRKRGERADSIMSDASWAPSVAPSSPISARTTAPRASAANNQPAIREETPFSLRGETPTPSTPKRALRQTPSLEQPILIPPPPRKRAKPIFAKNQILLTTVPLPDGPLPIPSAGAKGAQPMRLVKKSGRPREIPQPLDYILSRAEAAQKAKEAAVAAAVAVTDAVKQELSAPSTPVASSQTQVGSSQVSLPGPSQSQSSQASQMLPPTLPRRNNARGKRKEPSREDEDVISRAAEEWAYAKTGRYCGISFWEHKMAFERAAEERRRAALGAGLFGPALPGLAGPQPPSAAFPPSNSYTTAPLQPVPQWPAPL